MARTAPRAKPGGGQARSRRIRATLTRLANAAECLRSLRSLPHSSPFARMGLAAFSLSVSAPESDTTDTGQQSTTRHHSDAFDGLESRARDEGRHHSDDRGA